MCKIKITKENEDYYKAMNELLGTKPRSQAEGETVKNIIANQKDNPYFTDALTDRIAVQVAEGDTYGLAVEIAELNACIHEMKTKLLNLG